jgi:hypothetical protein
MGSLGRRIDVLEGLYQASEPAGDPAAAQARRTKMRETLQEIAAARREGREPSREAREAIEALERRHEGRER